MADWDCGRGLQCMFSYELHRARRWTHSLLPTIVATDCRILGLSNAELAQILGLSNAEIARPLVPPVAGDGRTRSARFWRFLAFGIQMPHGGVPGPIVAGDGGDQGVAQFGVRWSGILGVFSVAYVRLANFWLFLSMVSLMSVNINVPFAMRVLFVQVCFYLPQVSSTLFDSVFYNEVDRIMWYIARKE